MKQLKINTTFSVFENLEELPSEVRKVMKAAIEARNNAYAPYSKFRVGAALSLDNGQLITGSNQENACYPSGLCAERVAIYHAGAMFPKAAIQILAITAASENYTVTQPAPPCGACRQSIAEFEYKQKTPISIYFMGETGKIIHSSSLANLLPLSFDKDFLK